MAVSEILSVARRDAVRGAEGAVMFLEKVSPAVRDVDSSSGVLGSADFSAVASVVPNIASAPVPNATRAQWLELLSVPDQATFERRAEGTSSP